MVPRLFPATYGLMSIGASWVKTRWCYYRHSMTVDYAKKSVVVRHDPAKPIQPERLLGVVKAAGYTATLLEPNP